MHASSLRPELPPVEQVRCGNAAARQAQSYQDGLLAWLRWKSGGTQRVVVQYVRVGAGGQAVVTGSLKGARRQGGSRTPGASPKQSRTP